MQKHYLIVGGTTGLGAVYVKKLHNNVKISVIGNEFVENNHNISYYQVNLANESSTEDILKKITEKQIDYVVFFQRYRGDTKKSFEGEFQISVKATFLIMENIREFLNRNASIVIIGSIVTQYFIYEQPISYSVAKSALKSLVRYYAVHLGEKNIRVNMLSPSSCIKSSNAKYYNQEKNLKIYKELCPLKRIANSDDIYNALNFLLSDDCSYITGQEIVMDGGISLIGSESLLKNNGSISIN